MAKLSGESRVDQLCKELSEKFGLGVSKDVFDPEAGTEGAEPEPTEPAPPVEPKV